MPIVNFGQTIFIAHKIAGAHPHIQELGEMSLELAIWLEAELNRTLLRERGDTTTLTQNAQNAQNAQNNQDSTNTTDGITNFFGQPQIRAIVERAENAEERGYTPQLRDEYGNLTPEGRIKAELVTEIIREINEYRDNWAYSPMSWMQADEILLNATIPVRSLRMLQKLSTGIAEAEQAHTQGKLAKTIIPEEKDKKPHVGVMSIKDTRSHVATPNRRFYPKFTKYQPGPKRLCLPQHSDKKRVPISGT